MLSSRSSATLSSVERRTLARQWLRSGQCVRCFHASLRTNAEEGASTRGPKRGPTRKERSAMISDEVFKVQQGGSPSNQEPAQRKHFNARKPGSGGQAAGSSTAKHEGGAQQRSRPAKNGPASDKPSQGGAGAKRGPPQPTSSQVARSPRQPLGVSFRPQELSNDTLLYSGAGSATIANGNFEGVIEDHLKAVVDPGQRGPRTPTRAASKFWQNQLVRFSSKQDAERVTEVLKRDVLKAHDQLDQQLSKNKFQSVSAEVQQALSDRMVRGVYDAEGLLEGKQVYEQPVLNSVAQSLLKNPTYLSQDRSRLVSKVQSLLPASAAAASKKRAPQQKAA